MSELTMSREEREAFLAGVHVGVLSVADDEGGGPLTMPVWYRYEPGDTIAVITGPATRKASLIAKAGRFSLCVQSEQPPYAYVSIAGPVVDSTPVEPEARAEMAHRYLGKEMGDMYLAATEEEQAHDIVLRMRPERWRTADFSKQFGNPPST
jgi:nitroimidazol reductase NimA-like FMN-containing flavoprotein (pyridoxamine 5'-phosphate oxidase superfamily)